MTQEQINELRKLAEAATPGPWNTSPGGCGIIGPDKQWLGGMNDWVCEYSEEMTQSENNAAFIAAANPAAILDMIAEVESLRDQVNGLTGELGRERKRLDWAVSRESFYDHTTRVFFCDRAFKIPNPQVRIETDNFRATIDELMGQS